MADVSKPITNPALSNALEALHRENTPANQEWKLSRGEMLIFSLREVGGAGAEPPQNLTTTAAAMRTVLPLE